jgi:hypothetical protein
MVSIIVTFILIIVISITVLGFAQIVRRAGRQALDAQLSSQAFYAAETGVNDALYALSQQSSNTVIDKIACDGKVGTVEVKYIIDDPTNTKYTCLLVNNHPPQQVVSGSPTDPAKVIPLKLTGGVGLETLKLDWLPGNSNPVTAAACNLTDNPPSNAWTCPYAVLRIDLTPESAFGGDRNKLLANTFTAFLYPNIGGAGSVSYASGTNNIYGVTVQQGVRVNANCSTSICTTTINGLDAGSAGPGYYARVSFLYQPTSKLTITPTSTVGGTPTFEGGQVLIDSTGKSQDVLRRIKVYQPLYASGDSSDYAVETYESLCKQFTTFGGTKYSEPAICN